MGHMEKDRDKTKLKEKEINQLGYYKLKVIPKPGQKISSILVKKDVGGLNCCNGPKCILCHA